MNGTDDRSAEELYRYLQQHCSEGTTPPAAILREVLFHPISQQKLATASAVVLRGSRADAHRHNEVMQEACLHVLHRIEQGQLTFEPRGVDRFLNWLWSLWRLACLQVWRRMRRRRARQPVAGGGLPDVQQPDDQNEIIDHQHWPAILAAIGTVTDETVRETLSDWAQGLNGREAATRRGVRKSTISKRRAKAVALLRSQLNSDQPPPGA